MLVALIVEDATFAPACNAIRYGAQTAQGLTRFVASAFLFATRVISANCSAAVQVKTRSVLAVIS